MIKYLVSSFILTTLFLAGVGCSHSHDENCCSPVPGENLSITLAGVGFTMKYVPGGTFPTGVDDLGGNMTVSEFWMGETEVTYELWNAVYSKASVKGYTFADPGRQGSGIGTGPVGSNQHPVTTINWRDAMVWCNLASELAGLTAVYKYNGAVVKDARDTNDTACDNVTDDAAANGFRLPESMQWECAARYRGTDSTNSINVGGIYWTKGNSASGAIADYTNNSANDTVAVYGNHSDQTPTGVTSTAVVKSKGENGKNTLGLYDMSGNVWEWCFDWYTDVHTSDGSARGMRGGEWADFADSLQVGWVGISPSGLEGGGFRLVRTK